MVYRLLLTPLLASDVYDSDVDISEDERVKEYAKISSFIDNVNGYERVLEEELKSFYDSLNIYDCAYMILLKDYSAAKTIELKKTLRDGTEIEYAKVVPESVKLRGVEAIQEE